MINQDNVLKFQTVAEIFKPEENEQPHMTCEYCSEETGADVWHPWQDYYDVTIGHGYRSYQKILCPVEFAKFDNIVGYLDEEPAREGE